MQEQIDKVLRPEFIEEAQLADAQVETIRNKLNLLKNFKVFAQFTNAWEFQLVSGELDYYIKHKEKTSDTGRLVVCHYAILFSSHEVLDMLKQWNESLLASTLKEDMIAYVLVHAPDHVLDWVRLHYKDSLSMKADGCNLAHIAASFGLVATLDWIKKNEDWMLKELSEGNNASILHLASASGSQQALDFCYNYDKTLASLPDHKGINYTNYALGTFNPSHLNYALSLSDKAWSLENIFLEEPWHFKMLATIELALDDNISLHSISYQNFDKQSKISKIFVNEIQKKLNRNIQIYEDVKAIHYVFKWLYLGLLLDESSAFASSFHRDLCTAICSVLFKPIPEKLSHLVNLKFFDQVYKNLECKIKDVDPLLDGENVYCTGYKEEILLGNS